MSDKEKTQSDSAKAKSERARSKTVPSGSAEESKSPTTSKSSGASPLKKFEKFFDSFKVKSPKSGHEKTKLHKSTTSPVLSSESPDVAPATPSRKYSPDILTLSSPSSVEDYSVFDHRDENLIADFLRSQTCYDAMPDGGEVVLLSPELMVKDAFNYLQMHGLRAAPLWDNETYVGTLTIMDFIDVLVHYYKNFPEKIRDIRDQKIIDWSSITNVMKRVDTIHPKKSLFHAAAILIRNRLHSLLVIDENNNCLHVLTKKIILQYLYNNITGIKNLPTMKKCIGDLRPNLGTWGEIVKVSPHTKVIEALELLSAWDVSALLVTSGAANGIFGQTDVFNLAKILTEGNLDMTVIDALGRIKAHESLRYCDLDDTLGKVMDIFMDKKAARVLVREDRMKPTMAGWISLSDILNFLIPKLSGENVVSAFLACRTTYDAMLHCGEVPVIPADLSVQKAFKSLVVNNNTTAPVVDTKTSTFVGMISISDFTDVLWNNHGIVYTVDIKKQKIMDWIEGNERKEVKILPSDSLFKVTRLLIEERSHGFPVIDDRNPAPIKEAVFVVTKKGLLRYVYKNLSDRVKSSYLLTKLVDVKQHVGTWENIATISPSTKVIEALEVLSDRKISALPIIDEERVVNIFDELDVCDLAKERKYTKLDMTVEAALKKIEEHEDVHVCAIDVSLRAMIAKLTSTKVKAHHLIVVDDLQKRSIIGMISLSDILNFLAPQHIGFDSADQIASRHSLNYESEPISDTILKDSEVALVEVYQDLEGAAGGSGEVLEGAAGGSGEVLEGAVGGFDPSCV